MDAGAQTLIPQISLVNHQAKNSWMHANSGHQAFILSPAFYEPHPGLEPSAGALVPRLDRPLSSAAFRLPQKGRLRIPSG